MKKAIVDQLRMLASVSGKQRTWVSELSDDNLYQLFLKLRAGESAASIARYVQKVWKVNPDSSTHSLSQGVLKFGRRIAHLLPMIPSSGSDGTSASDLFEGLGEESPLERMETIAEKYETRIRRMIAEEQETGAKYSFINRDLQALASLRKAILRQREWEIFHENPLRRKKYERMEQTMDRRFNRLMEGITEDGQDRLIKAAYRFLELAEQKALTMYKKKDGTYSLIAPEKKP